MTQLDGFARRQRGANLRRLRLRRRREDCPDGCCWAAGGHNRTTPLRRNVCEYRLHPDKTLVTSAYNAHNRRRRTA